MTRTSSLWEVERLTFEHSVALTIDSVCAYGSGYRHWAIASSGGRDSSTTVTLIVSLIAAGAVPAPESLTVLYADTDPTTPGRNMRCVRMT